MCTRRATVAPASSRRRAAASCPRGVHRPRELGDGRRPLLAPPARHRSGVVRPRIRGLDAPQLFRDPHRVGTLRPAARDLDAVRAHGRRGLRVRRSGPHLGHGAVERAGLATSARRVAVALAIAGALVASWPLNVLDVRARAPFASVASAFGPAPGYPGYQWSRDGRDATDEVTTISGPAHCGWQSATMPFIGWPLGTRATTSSQTRMYIR